MKTIATAAVLMMLAVSAWADDAEKQTNDPANTDEPIVLSEAEMDGVTAGNHTFTLTAWYDDGSTSAYQRGRGYDINRYHSYLPEAD